MTPRTAAPFVIIIALIGPPAAFAADPLRFAWQKGQTLTFKVSQNTTVEETAFDEQAKAAVTTKTVTAVVSTKRWTVTAVDSAGAATLELGVLALRQEITQTVGSEKPTSRTIDSANADDAKGMAFLNKTVLTATVDARGELVSAKADNPAAADRLKAELPFRLVLPEKAPAADDTWTRAFQLVAPPPLGTGEKYDATQTYTVRGTKDQYLVVGLTTALKSPPTDPAEMPALLPSLWKGDVFFDTKGGRYHGAKLTTGTEVKNHRGEGSKLTHQSEYTEVAEK